MLAAREADALLVQDESTRNQQEGQQNGISEAAAPFFPFLN